MLGWTAVEDALLYEFCTSPIEATFARLCTRNLTEPSVPISWETILGAADEASDTVVLTGGWRTTSIPRLQTRAAARA